MSWVQYKNGNYTVKFNTENGTKIRETEDDFIPVFAENCDVCLTKRCDGGCSFCYEGCTVDGKHSDIMNQKWVDTLHPYTELALNGNDMTHPDLTQFLYKLKDKKVIANLTVNQKHFERHFDLLKDLCDKKLVYGLGVSLVDANEDFIRKIKEFPNAVIHTINGILTPSDVEALSNHGLKLLILGYKDCGRGTEYHIAKNESIAENQNWLKDNVVNMLQSFDVISFDNLAIKQLDIQSKLPKEQWDEFYMGDDGGFTFYIDAVDHKFCKNSITPLNERYDLLDSVDEMFEKIRLRR